MADAEVLDLGFPRVINAAVSAVAVRKIIDALLLLEGHELVDAGAELHLKRILTEEQCTTPSKFLQKPRAEMQEPSGVMPGSAPDPYKDRIIIRPEMKN